MSGTRHSLLHHGKPVEVTARAHPAHVEVEGPEGSVRLEALQEEGARIVLQAGERIVSGVSILLPDRVIVAYEGRTWVFERSAPGSAGRPADGPAGALRTAVVESPMTGTVLEVRCQAGEEVEAGTALVVVEAMKMEHRLIAPARARVKEVLVAAGQAVDIGQILVRLEPPEPPGESP